MASLKCHRRVNTKRHLSKKYKNILYRKIEITSHRNWIIELAEHVAARIRYIKTAHTVSSLLGGGGGTFIQVVIHFGNSRIVNDLLI